MSVLDGVIPVGYVMPTGEEVPYVARMPSVLDGVTPIQNPVQQGPQPYTWQNAVNDVGQGVKGAAEYGAAAVNQLGRDIGNGFQAVGQGIDWLANTGNRLTGNTSINPVSAAGGYIKSGYDKLADYNTQALKVNSGFNPNSPASQGGKITGDVAASVAASAALTGGLPKIPIAGHPALAAYANTAITSPITTASSIGVTEGRLPTAQEYGTYGLLDLLFTTGSLIGGKIYRSAFKGTAGQEKSLIKNYNTTVGDTAENLGYVGDEKKIRAKVGKALIDLGDQFDIIEGNAKAITPEEFIDTATKNLRAPFAAGPDNDFKRNAYKMIDDLISQYVPDAPMTGKQAADIVSTINGQLFRGGNAVVLKPGDIDSMANGLKNSVKELLPPEIRSVYEKYSMNKLIGDVMANAQVKRLIFRSTLGGIGTGLTTGVLAYGATKGDIFKTISSAVAGFITGWFGLKATGNIGVSTSLGQMLKFGGTAGGEALYKGIYNSVNDTLAGYNDFRDFTLGYQSTHPGATADQIQQAFNSYQPTT